MEMSESKQTVIKVPHGVKSIVEQFAKKNTRKFSGSRSNNQRRKETQTKDQSNVHLNIQIPVY